MALVAVLVLTLGIGLTTMMYSIVYGALIKGLPYDGGERIMEVVRSNPELDIRTADLSLQDFVDLRAQPTRLQNLSAYTSGTMNVSGRDKAERFSGSWVSSGLYAVMSFSVSGRSREMGVRMALGASARNVVGLVLRQGAWQLSLGLALGLTLAAAISRVMTVILFDVQPLDVVVFGSVASVLTLAGMAACLLPARRATLVDPAVAMRVE